jgi:hypothetical protein
MTDARLKTHLPFHNRPFGMRAASLSGLLRGLKTIASAYRATALPIVTSDHTRLYRLGKWAALRKTSLMRACQPGPDAR